MTSLATKSVGHLTQFRHARYNPNGEISSNNCGPASLALVKSMLGRPFSGDAQQQIDSARYAMFADVNRRRQCLHFTQKGHWRDAEASQSLSDLCDLQRGAQRLGLGNALITDLEVLSHPYPTWRIGILAGTPRDSRTYRQLLKMDYQGGHFVVVFQQGTRLRIWDTLSTRPGCKIPYETLRDFASRRWFREGYGTWLFQARP